VFFLILVGEGQNLLCCEGGEVLRDYFGVMDWGGVEVYCGYMLHVSMASSNNKGKCSSLFKV
jgi:hypothetical protein